MSRVTNGLRITIPKRLAERCGIRPGDEVEWILDGKGLRIEAVDRRKPLDSAERLGRFDESEQRQRERESREEAIRQRGWRREDLYTRGSPR